MCDRARGFTRSVVVLAVLAVVTLMATSVAAQSTTGAILGRITDPQGLALPGATVTATNTETGQTRTVVTDSEGTFNVTTLVGRIQRRWKGAQWSLARAMRSHVKVRTEQGVLTLSTRDNVISRLLYCEGQYQLDLTLKALAFLRDKGLIPPRGEGVALDVGANNGVVSIGMLVRNEIAAAVGIEPEPVNYALLKQNVLENNLAGRYTALNIAASDRSGDLRFEISRDNFGDHRVQSLANHALVPERGNEVDREVIAVPASPIDEIVEKLPQGIADAISLVWIDVQGHEGYVFLGGARLFSRNVPVVAEIWPWGIMRSGMGVDQFCKIAVELWPSYWAWRKCRRFVRYPTTDLVKFCEELGDQGEFDDVIFANA